LDPAVAGNQADADGRIYQGWALVSLYMNYFSMFRAFFCKLEAFTRKKQKVVSGTEIFVYM
jgi:hypothetical protein